MCFYDAVRNCKESKVMSKIVEVDAWLQRSAGRTTAIGSLNDGGIDSLVDPLLSKFMFHVLVFIYSYQRDKQSKHAGTIFQPCFDTMGVHYPQNRHTGVFCIFSDSKTESP